MHRLILKVAKKYKFIVLNENLCYVEYQNDGMTANQWKQYYNSPNSFAEIRKLNLSLSGGTPKYYFKQAIHYCSSCRLAGRKNWLRESPKKIYTLLSYIPGCILTLFIKMKQNN